MNNIDQFRKNYPLQSIEMDGKKIQYRYHNHPTANKTLVLLAGGIGLSDLFFLHFEEFTKDFSVITFDYQMNYPDNTSLANGIAGLLKILGIKAYLVGQSLGGIVAQIITKEHPSVVEGLVLSNTGSMAAKINDEGEKCLLNMLEGQKKFRKHLKLIPFWLLKRLMKIAVMKKTKDLTHNESKLMEHLCTIMVQILTKKYELHMIDLLIDVKNHRNMTPKDFAHLENKVLLLLSDDDITFNQEVKDSLIALMPSPKVITNLTGGHLALLIRLEEYTKTVRDFISKK